MLADMIKQDVIEKKPKKMRNEDEDIRGIINNLRNKDQNGYYPTTLPFKLNDIEDTNIINDLINNKGNLNENEIFLFQLPRIIPYNLEVQEKLKNEEILNEEPQFDQNGYLIQSGFSNSFNSMKTDMKLGKIKFYKSGKIKMEIGNTLFDVNGGVTCKFAQEVSLYSEETDELVFLGKINDKKVVVTPDFNY